MQSGVNKRVLLQNLAQLPAQQSGLQAALVERRSQGQTTEKSRGSKNKAKVQKGGAQPQRNTSETRAKQLTQQESVTTLISSPSSQSTSDSSTKPSVAVSTSGQGKTRQLDEGQGGEKSPSRSSQCAAGAREGSVEPHGVSHKPPTEVDSRQASRATVADVPLTGSRSAAVSQPSSLVASTPTGKPPVSSWQSQVVRLCDGCGREHEQLGQCGRCRVARYCSAACLRTDYARHSAFCLRFKARNRPGQDR